MGDEMMNRFLGIAQEMVFNRHRRREILFWWLTFFLGFLFFCLLVLFYSMGTRNPGGEAHRKLQQRACWKLYSPVYLAFCGLSTANTAMQSCNYKYLTARERFLDTNRSWKRHTTASIAYYV